MTEAPTAPVSREFTVGDVLLMAAISSVALARNIRSNL